MKKIGRLFQGLLLLALVAVLGINGILLVKRLAFHEPLPSVFGYSVVSVLSGSMEPEFSPGDMLVIRRQQEYQVGNVVTYEHQGSFITHRIVEADGDRWLTKGDANNAVDERPVAETEIYGEVCVVLPGLGNVALFLKTPLGMLVLILGFVGLVELSFRMDRRKRE